MFKSAILRFIPDGQSLNYRRASLLSVGLAVAYVVTIGWLHHIDIYHLHFFESGAVIAIYQLARLFFAFALAWLVYATGAAAIAATAGSAYLWNLAAYERYPLGFFIGGGLWHLALYGLGFAGLYTWPVMATMTIIAVILSIPHLTACLLSARWKSFRIQSPASFEGAASLVLVVGLLCVGAAFVLIRGLYPLGGHDYYMHYFHYLTEVVRSGSLRPNAVWYHFYDSKGMSLFFLGMILTDPTAPGLVSTVYIGFGTCIIYAMLHRATGTRLLPLCGAILYIAFFVIGNDELEKQHIPAAVLCLAMLWATIGLTDDRVNPWPWVIMLWATVITIILVTVEIGLLVSLYFGGLIVWYAWQRKWRRAFELFSVASITVIGVAAIGALNYAYTGLPLAHFLLDGWRFADLNRLRDWGVLYEALTLHAAFTGASLANGSFSLAGLLSDQAWSWSAASNIANYFRLTLWWPLVIPIVLFLPWRLRNGAARRLASSHYLSAFYILLWFSACLLIVTILVGMTEVDSFMRLMSLAYPIPLCVFLLLWHIALHPLKRGASLIMVGRVAVACATLAALGPLATYVTARPELSSAGLRMITSHSWSLMTGQFSLKDAYQHQLGWLAKHPTGGIYPGIVEPWKIAGPGTPIVSFHIHDYCMLPDCNLIMPITFRLGKDWRTPYIAYTAAPDVAAQQLHRDGVDYFFFSKDLPFAIEFVGYGVAPIFSPEHIRSSLAVRWTDGTNYLLTWPGKDTKPIDDNFMKFYTEALQRQGAQKPGVDTDYVRQAFDQRQAIFEYLERHAADLHPFALPWCRNCQGLPKLND